MATKTERTALLFLGAVVLAGGIVRLARAARNGLKPPPSAQAALAGQRVAVDSAAVELAVRRAASRGASRPASGPGRRSAPSRTPVSPRTRREAVVVPVSPAVTAPPAPVDVDRASASELEALPRVGPALAARIVAERDKNGPFGSMEALDARVKGVGPAMVKALQSLVTFSGH